ncbi:MAG: hypothetical protein LBC13_00100 [Clostridiales bacterium]|jgi:uncharacterized protein YjdB|nr:hypothetical protein [Clostridiales bacterium]
MKKLLIAILLLVPLTIAMIVSLTTSYISSTVEIPVESISLLYNGKETATSVVYVGDTGKLSANVLPNYATNKKVSFEIIGDDEALLRRVSLNSATGEIRFTDVGAVTVRGVSEDGGLQAFIQFFVVRLNPERVTVKLPEHILAGDVFMLDAKAEPYDIENKNLIFTSDDPNVAEVDRNGIVFAKKTGTARIIVRSAQDEKVFERVTITVLSSAPTTALDAPAKLFNRSEIISSSDRLDLFPYLTVSNIPVLTVSPADAAEVSNGTIIFKRANESITVTANGYESAAFMYSPASRAVEIRHKDLLPQTITAGGRTLYLDGAYAAAGVTGSLVYSSSDESVAAVDSYGKVTVLSDGTVSLGVTDAVSGEYDEITVTAVLEVLWASLNLNEYTDATAGIKRERVYGKESFKNGNLLPDITHSLYFTDVYPKQSLEGLNGKFTWSSSDESVAKAENGEVVLNAESLPDSGLEPNVKVTITAVPKFYSYEILNSEFSYTFTFNGGIDVYDYQGLVYALTFNRTVNFQADIECESQDRDMRNIALLNVFSNINGNGHVLKAGAALDSGNENSSLVRIAKDGLILDNLQMRLKNFEGGIADLYQFQGAPKILWISGSGVDNDDGITRNVTVKNCLIENANLGVVISDADDVTIAGCVFRNLLREGIALRNRKDGNGKFYGMDMVLKNTVFYDCLLLPLMPEPNVDKESFEIQNRVDIYGFFKVYGWRDVNSLPLEGLLDDLQYASGLGSLLVNSIKETLSQNKKYAKTLDGTDYYLFTIAQLGAKLQSFELVREIMKVTFHDDKNWTEMRLKGSILGLNGFDLTASVWTLPPGSNYIGFNDTFGDADRQAMREP